MTTEELDKLFKTIREENEESDLDSTTLENIYALARQITEATADHTESIEVPVRVNEGNYWIFKSDLNATTSRSTNGNYTPDIKATMYARYQTDAERTRKLALEGEYAHLVPLLSPLAPQNKDPELRSAKAPSSAKHYADLFKINW